MGRQHWMCPGIKIDERGTGTSSLSLKMKNEKSPWGAGGLFGCLSGTGEGSGITNSELSISMTAEKDGDNYGSLGGVSGIIDESDLKVSGVTVSQSGSNGIILDNKSGDDNSYSESAGTGGIAGIVSDSVLNIQDSAVQSGDELAQIHGPCNTGGLVGYSDNKSSLNMKNCHVSWQKLPYRVGKQVHRRHCRKNQWRSFYCRNLRIFLCMRR